LFCGATVFTLKGHSQAILGLAFSPDGRVLASAAGKAQTIWLWDVTARAPIV
jgi:WD40 repeat protein